MLLFSRRFLLSQPRKRPLLGTLLDHILFNARLWINTPFKVDFSNFCSPLLCAYGENFWTGQFRLISFQVQLHLFSVFATDLISTLGCADLMRREVGVNKFIDMLRTHYWVVRPQNIPETGKRITVLIGDWGTTGSMTPMIFGDLKRNLDCWLKSCWKCVLSVIFDKFFVVFKFHYKHKPFSTLNFVGYPILGFISSHGCTYCPALQETNVCFLRCERIYCV